MIIEPKIRGFICTTAHPIGCEQHVNQQIETAKATQINGAKRVLVIGSSTGYGLASRIAATFCCGADTVGVFFEREAAGNRTATAGWYNNRAFEKQAHAAGRVAVSLNADAYSTQAKQDTIALIKQNMPDGKVDIVIYSLASPRRTCPDTGKIYSSVIKPIGETFTQKTLDFHTGVVSQVAIPPATEQEIADTVAVMGGEDWLLWMSALQQAGVLANNAATVSFSYIGPELTHRVYKDGTIGKAKEDLQQKSSEINDLLSPINGAAFVCVNKALVTQSSSAIPVVPLYISILYAIMKKAGTHENCIDQMVRMFAHRLYPACNTGDFAAIPVDDAGRIRLDDLEMASAVQKEIAKLWQNATTENIAANSDLAGYKDDFYNLFGFGINGVDYTEDIGSELL